ncbi:hypothetical protein D3C86_826500 [compost metagenome]
MKKRFMFLSELRLLVVKKDLFFTSKCPIPCFPDIQTMPFWSYCSQVGSQFDGKSMIFLLDSNLFFDSFSTKISTP